MSAYRIQSHRTAFMFIVFSIVLSACSVFSSSYPAGEQAKQTSDRAVKTHFGYRFEAKAPTKAQFIFYPGAKVEPQAYALLAQRLAEQNIQVDLVDFPLDLAITKSSIAEDIIDESLPTVIAGHSLGGAMAARFLKKNWKQVDGLVLLASYSLDSYGLQHTTLPVLSIYAELDLIATVEEILDKQAYLPANTQYVMIKGGNHGQFGDYGAQSGDGEALISAQAQLDQTVEAIIGFIDGLSGL